MLSAEQLSLKAIQRRRPLKNRVETENQNSLNHQAWQLVDMAINSRGNVGSEQCFDRAEEIFTRGAHNANKRLTMHGYSARIALAYLDMQRERTYHESVSQETIAATRAKVDNFIHESHLPAGELSSVERCVISELIALELMLRAGYNVYPSSPREETPTEVHTPKVSHDIYEIDPQTYRKTPIQVKFKEEAAASYDERMLSLSVGRMIYDEIQDSPDNYELRLHDPGFRSENGSERLDAAVRLFKSMISSEINDMGLSDLHSNLMSRLTETMRRKMETHKNNPNKRLEAFYKAV